VSPAKRRESQFQRAAEGNMTLVEHLQELRTRLFRASLAIVAGAIAGFFVSERVQGFIIRPYCNFYIEHHANASCTFNTSSPLEVFMNTLKIALYVGLFISSPIWLYQLWAFIAPGLHRRERRYTYSFAAVAAPLFVIGASLGYLLISRSMVWLLGINPDFTVSLSLEGYFSFITSVMLLFGVGFELPLIVVMFNFAGVISAKRLLSWWRVAIFLMFFFAAIVTPTPDPFNMTILATCLGLLYFAAVGVAFINDARRARRNPYANLGDDEISSLDDDVPSHAPTSPVDGPNWGRGDRDNYDGTT
jgi:sec-independent protein translocase protein TatC